jgi:hypothetical protein
MKVRSQPYPPPTTTCGFAGEVDYNKNYQDFIDRGVRMFEGRFTTHTTKLFTGQQRKKCRRQKDKMKSTSHFKSSK